MKIADEGLYEVLATCIKEATKKEVRAAFNAKTAEKGFP